MDTTTIVLCIVSFQLGVAENIIISPTCDFMPSSCVTLSQYASINITTSAALVLLPGDHDFDMLSLRAEDVEFFYLQGQSNQVAVIECSLAAHFEFIQVNVVVISNIVLMNCYINVEGSRNTTTVSISYVDIFGIDLLYDRSLRIVGSNNVSISHSTFQDIENINASNTIILFSRVEHLEIFYCMIRNISVSSSSGYESAIIIEVQGTDKAEILQSIFTDNTIDYSGSIVLFWSSVGYISSTVFKDNTGVETSYYYGYRDIILLIVDCNYMVITNTTFINNVINASYGSIILFDSLAGYIACSTFWNNAVGDNIIYYSSATNAITNSTFAYNKVGESSAIIRCLGFRCIIISSVFKYNYLPRHGYCIHMPYDDPPAELFVLASEFAHNNIGNLIEIGNSELVIDCTTFFNNSFLDIISRNSTECNKQFEIGEEAICSDCEGTHIPYT